jgi:hypothetical protein
MNHGLMKKLAIMTFVLPAIGCGSLHQERVKNQAVSSPVAEVEDRSSPISLVDASGTGSTPQGSFGGSPTSSVYLGRCIESVNDQFYVTRNGIRYICTVISQSHFNGECHQQISCQDADEPEALSADQPLPPSFVLPARELTAPNTDRRRRGEYESLSSLGD